MLPNKSHSTMSRNDIPESKRNNNQFLFKAFLKGLILKPHGSTNYLLFSLPTKKSTQTQSKLDQSVISASANITSLKIKGDDTFDGKSVGNPISVYMKEIQPKHIIISMLDP